MPLRATKPEATSKRLKLFMFGPAGVGKTMASIQFPNAYVIDCERGTENYSKTINAAGSVVYNTVDVFDMIQEVKTLLTERHDFRTLVIDPITPVFNDLLEKSEAKVGADFGRHYGEANKQMKRLANLIMQLDMNVVITAHAKTEYGENLKKLGYTFDGWRQLDYWFDLVIELAKKGQQRLGRVVKTRIETFPDEDVFQWGYDAIRQRWDASILERPAVALELATPPQIARVRELVNIVRLPDGLIEKWFSKASVDVWDDMPRDVIAKCIEYIEARFPQAAPPPAPKAKAMPPAAEFNPADGDGEASKAAPAQPAAQERLPREYAAKDVEEWSAFTSIWESVCIDNGWNSEQCQTILAKRLRVIQRHTTPQDTSTDWRLRTIKMAQDKRIDPETGENLKAVL